MRNSPSQLPDKNELRKLMAAEAKRDVPESKINVHFATINPFVAYLKRLHIDTTSLQMGISLEKRLEIGRQLIDQAVKVILEKGPGDIGNLYKYLAEEDELEKADVIFVFGGKTILRAQKGVELFHAGWAPYIMFSGRSPFYEKKEPEALVYKQYALKKGVPNSAILTEPNSITFIDNVRRSLNFLDETSFEYEKIILVNSTYCQRRAAAIMQKYTKAHVKLIRVNAVTPEGLTEKDWFKNEEGIRIVLNEYVKIWGCLVDDII